MTTAEDIERAIEQLGPESWHGFVRGSRFLMPPSSTPPLSTMPRLESSMGLQRKPSRPIARVNPGTSEALQLGSARTPITIDRLRYAYASAIFLSTALKRMLRLPASAVASATAPSSV